MLSMPKTASPNGLSLVRISLDTISPTSPWARIFTVIPELDSKFCNVCLSTANESWVTSVTVPVAAEPLVAGPTADVPVDVGPLRTCPAA